MKILYHGPSYHSSFFERDALMRRGHIVDIYVPPGFPEKLLWDQKQTFTRPKSLRALEKVFGSIPFPAFLNRVRSVMMFVVTIVPMQLWLIRLWRRYDCVYIFGRSDLLSYIPFLEKKILKLVIKGKINFRVLPAGCRDEALQSYWREFDNGNVCGSCFIAPWCDDTENAENLLRIKKFDMKVAGNGSHNPPGLNAVHFRSRSLDLTLWKPELVIPEQYLLPKTDAIRVLHSFASNGRGGSVNIKGSNYVEAAIESLQRKGYNVELISATDLHLTEMRYLQSQCDILVDQLIYGWWGSTALEGAALGKPVICYLRESFIATFLETFPLFRGKVPVVNANIHTVEQELQRLLDSPELRETIGRQSREFAENFLDPDTNAVELEDFLSL